MFVEEIINSLGLSLIHTSIPWSLLLSETCCEGQWTWHNFYLWRHSDLDWHRSPLFNPFHQNVNDRFGCDRAIAKTRSYNEIRLHCGHHYCHHYWRILVCWDWMKKPKVRKLRHKPWNHRALQVSNSLSSRFQSDFICKLSTLCRIMIVVHITKLQRTNILTENLLIGVHH